MKKTILACFAIVLALFMVACDDTPPQPVTTEGYSKPDWVQVGTYKRTAPEGDELGDMTLDIKEQEFSFSMLLSGSIPITANEEGVVTSTKSSDSWEIVINSVSIMGNATQMPISLTVTSADNGGLSVEVLVSNNPLGEEPLLFTYESN